MNLREWALPVYTILIQLAVGTLLSLWCIRSSLKKKHKQDEANIIIRNPILVIVFTTVFAMLGAHFHLSKPWLSFLAVLNFESSWLSREILASVLFSLTIGSLWLINLYRTEKWIEQTVLGWTAVLLGLMLNYIISRVYMLPTQVAWNSPLILLSFYVTTFLLGTMALICLLILDLKYAEFQKPENVQLHSKVIRQNLPWISGAAILFFVFDIAIIWEQLRQFGRGDIIMGTSLRLLLDLYKPILVMRLIFLIVAPIILGFASYLIHVGKKSPQKVMPQIYLSCLLVLVAEIIGRFLFYATHIRIGV